MKTSSSPCLNDIMATGNDSGHSDQWSPNSSMALGHQYRHRRWLRPWATIWSSVTTKVRSINTDSGCDRTTGPDMVLSAVRVWMSPWTQLAVQAGHLDGNVALGHQYGSRWQTRSLALIWPDYIKGHGHQHRSWLWQGQSHITPLCICLCTFVTGTFITTFWVNCTWERSTTNDCLLEEIPSHLTHFSLTLFDPPFYTLLII